MTSPTDMDEKGMERQLLDLQERRERCIATGDGGGAQRIREQYRLLHALWLAARAKRQSGPV